MKVLFATTNPAKIGKYREELEENGIELITINDLDFNLNIEENGKDAIENAYIKAKAYYDKTGLPTIGMDNSLFIEGLPDEKQPGTYVRRVNGKELTDEEMIEYYSNLVKEYGGKLTAKWIFGMALLNNNTSKTCSWSKEHFYFVDRPYAIRKPGYPLDSISIIPEFNKYFLELTEDEKKLYKKEDNKKQIVEFIIDNIKNSKL